MYFRDAEIGDEFYHIFRHPLSGAPESIAQYRVSDVSCRDIVCTLMRVYEEFPEGSLHSELHFSPGFVAREGYTDFSDVELVLQQLHVDNKRRKIRGYVADNFKDMPESMCDAILKMISETKKVDASPLKHKVAAR